MATQLTFDDLAAEAQAAAEENTLTFTAKNGEVVRLLPVLSLPKEDLLKVQELTAIVGDEDLDMGIRMDAIDKVLVTASDNKPAMADSLDALPLQARLRVFETWMEGLQVPQA